MRGRRTRGEELLQTRIAELKVKFGHNGCRERIQAASFKGSVPQILMQTGIFVKMEVVTQ